MQVASLAGFRPGLDAVLPGRDAGLFWSDGRYVSRCGTYGVELLKGRECGLAGSAQRVSDCNEQISVLSSQFVRKSGESILCKGLAHIGQD